MSFDVDQTGVPVLVKVSYFPNWEAEGAEGPYRVGPNMMVVVPTSNHVELTYGRSASDYITILLTLVGIGLCFVCGAGRATSCTPPRSRPRGRGRGDVPGRDGSLAGAHSRSTTASSRTSTPISTIDRSTRLDDAWTTISDDMS